MGYFFRKLSLVIIWILAALSMTLAVLTSAYESTLETHQRTIRAALLEARDNLPVLIQDEKTITDDYEYDVEHHAKMITLLQENGLEKEIPDQARLKTYARLLGASYIRVTDKGNKVVAEYGKAADLKEVADDKKEDYEEFVSTLGDALEGMGEEESKEYLSMVFLTTGNILLNENRDIGADLEELEGGYNLYYEFSNKRAIDLREDIYSWRAVMGEMLLPDDAYYIVISKLDDTILVHPEEEMVGKTLKDLGYSSKEELLENYQGKSDDGISFKTEMDQLFASNSSDKSSHLLTEMSPEYMLNYKPASAMYEDEWLYVICETPLSSVFKDGLQSLMNTQRFFLIGSFLVFCYIWFRFNEEIRNRKKHVEPGESGRFLIWSYDPVWAGNLIRTFFIVLIVTTVLTFQAQQLEISSHKIKQQKLEEQLEEKIKKRNEYCRKEMTAWYKERFLAESRMVSYVVTRDKKMQSRDTLKEIAEALNLNDVYIFSQDGVVEVTSSTYDHINLYSRQYKKTPMSETFRPLLDGMPENSWTPLQEKNYENTDSFAGTSIRNKKDLCDGCVGIRTSVPYIVTSGGFNMFTDTLTWAKDSRRQNQIFLSSAQLSMIFRSILVNLAVFLLVFCIGVFRRQPKGSSVKTEEKPKAAAGPGGEGEQTDLSFPVPDGVKAPTKRTKKAIAGKISKLKARIGRVFHRRDDLHFKERWSGQEMVPLRLQSPEKKLVLLIRVGLFLTAVFIVISRLTYGNGLYEDVLDTRVISGNWERGFNIHAFAAAQLIIIVAISFAWLAHKMVYYVAHFSSGRGETICHLINSLITYATVIIAGYYILGMFGVDTKTILASAGILGIVIGIGAKDTIADILAGLFLIFEDVVHVGDYIVMGDKSGVVMDIGVRMTRIQEDGTIYMVNNSDMKGAKNLSGGDARIVGKLIISTKQLNLTEITQIIERELPAMTQIMKEEGYATSDLWYSGIETFDLNTVTLRFDIFCDSYYTRRCSRTLNEELLLMCERNNIARVP